MILKHPFVLTKFDRRRASGPSGMNPWAGVGLVFLAFTTGCTHLQLERSTTSQAGTLTDLQYAQVLDNVALFARHPGALPHFAVTTTGTAQITDTGSTNDVVIPNAVFTARHTVWSGQYGVMGSRAIQENWTMVPVTDPDKLKRMRCAYQVLVGCGADECEDCVKKLDEFFCADQCKSKEGAGLENPGNCEHCRQCALPRGWFNVGPKKDVPKDACYVGHCCDTYVWVTPDGIPGLTRFTLAILDIATLLPVADTVQVKRIYQGDWVAGKPPVSTEVSHTEGAEPPKPGMAGTPVPTPKLRSIPPVIVPGGILPVPGR